MAYRSELREKFETEYARLNEQQKAAVDQIEGPVMVIAGPGTGKTQILSARIGKILLSDAQVEPDNILCLTYTDAGVVAMRRRLSGFIGPDAYRVALHTFHAFCNEVIQDNLGLFEKTALDPISDLERIELLKELIDGFGKDHPLKRYRGDVYFEMHNLQQLFSLMKREGWTPDYICQKVSEYLKDLPNRDEYICKRATKDFKKGDVRTDKIAEQEERMQKLIAACGEFTKFQELMRRRSRYDFDDMINWVIGAFQDNADLLRHYQEKYQYILVDEYQDTSGSQNRIVELLINYWDQPNVFVVGDDDQSIYRFQGANVENMMAFGTSFGQDLMTVVLTENYRSTQPILDISKSLIDRNEERLVKQIGGLSKNLRAANVAMAHLTHGPEVHAYATQGQELIGITTKIEALIKDGVEPSEIGIIYRENRYGEELAQYLRLKGIPFYSRRHLNILEQPLIRQLLQVLDYIVAERDTPYGGDGLLFEILHFEWFGIPPLEVAKAAMLVSDANYQDKKQKTSLRRYVCERSAPKDLFDKGLDRRLCETVHLLERLIGAAANETLANLLEKILREAGFLGHIMDHTERHWLLQLVTGFYNHVRDELRRHPYSTLELFMERLDLMRKEGLALPLVQVSGQEKGVNLLTCHGSKGLEFDYVFLAGSTASSWEKKRKPHSGFSFPDTLFASNAKGDDTEELRRLFYVALTRAKQHLYISYSNATEEGKLLEPSLFIAEIFESHPLPVQAQVLEAEAIAEFQTLQLTGLFAPEVAPLEEEMVARVLSGFQMNVSALNNYLRCPLEFYFRNIVRIPSPRNEAAEFGSAVHHALEQLFVKMKKDPQERFPALDDFLNDFTWYMGRNRECFTKEQFARRSEYGLEILKQYYNRHVAHLNKFVLIEHNVRSVNVDGQLLRGKLDKIEFRGNDVTIVDYKTGDPERSREKFARPNPKIPAGGDYWRQAVFYKIMIGSYKPEWNVTNVVFDFVEPNKKKEYVREEVLINDMDLQDVKAQVKDTYAAIQARRFYTGCGQEDCHWCKFVKTNKMTVALHELKQEEEESKRSMLRVVE
ncbi:ATP-dependent helicase [Flaviaesturariibacter aridisoli]|uniref:DNA 3'-5' helicase n=1 Tax=Flaviaesturariibacter aridisoli TaxID=2545761 RepID=A0A4R4E208_9BACT|nr:ATP-dependent DNA helicase [Flaviaesturariibacter aridisoli]TCZ72245.1 ATP-dependent helicase [Flaviaesturariibacter aridisoli]